MAELYSTLGRYKLTLCSYIIGIYFYCSVRDENFRAVTTYNFINES